MRRPKVMTVFGTRPEGIKMAPVVQALEASTKLDTVTVLSGQHRDMLDQVVSAFELTPHHDLAVMRHGQDLFDVTSRILVGMRDVLRAERPDAVLVHGDTTTCLAAGLAAFYERIPLGHVEAGLRTGDLSAPFPEEANRVLIDRLCTWWFAPTPRSADMLRAEGIDGPGLIVTGNTVIDALLWMRDRVAAREGTVWDTRYGSVAPSLAGNARMVLITGHRRESFGDGFVQICSAIRTLSERHPDVLFVYPVHMNPNVREPVNRYLSGVANIHLIEPQEYPDFVRLMDRAHIVLTDSGGIQEEAPSLGKPVLVMRETTERPEGIDSGTVRLVGTRADSIVENTHNLLVNEAEYERMSRAHNPYGDGEASQRIVAALESSLVGS